MQPAGGEGGDGTAQIKAPSPDEFLTMLATHALGVMLEAYVFEDLDEVREITGSWLRLYNEERPHKALGSLPPAAFRAGKETETDSTSELSR